MMRHEKIHRKYLVHKIVRDARKLDAGDDCCQDQLLGDSQETASARAGDDCCQSKRTLNGVAEGMRALVRQQQKSRKALCKLFRTGNLIPKNVNDVDHICVDSAADDSVEVNRPQRVRASRCVSMIGPSSRVRPFQVFQLDDRFKTSHRNPSLKAAFCYVDVEIGLFLVEP